MEALRAEMSIAELCRMYSVNESPFINGQRVYFGLVDRYNI